jgi:hypothetical protein
MRSIPELLMLVPALLALLVGLAIYFGYKHSRLNKVAAA